MLWLCAGGARTWIGRIFFGLQSAAEIFGAAQRKMDGRAAAASGEAKFKLAGRACAVKVRRFVSHRELSLSRARLQDAKIIHSLGSNFYGRFVGLRPQLIGRLRKLFVYLFICVEPGRELVGTTRCVERERLLKQSDCGK